MGLMRRLLGVLVCAALVVAGCGSSSSAPSASSVRNSELSYFPAGSPFVMSVVTDPNSAAVKGSEALVGHFPLATFGESALIAKLRQVGIDYQNDIRPLFGNPIVVGATGQSLSGVSTSGYLAVWVTKDASKLTALLKKVPGLKTVGSHDGATLYQTGGSTTVAVAGATLVLGPSESVVGERPRPPRPWRRDRRGRFLARICRPVAGLVDRGVRQPQPGALLAECGEARAGCPGSPRSTDTPPR